MKSNLKTIFIGSVLFLFINFTYSQEMCFHVSNKSNPSELVSYLSGRYAEEQIEQLVINIQNYENEHNVDVLCASEYTKTIARFQNLIDATTVIEEKNRLSDRLSRFVLISTIEDQIN